MRLFSLIFVIVSVLICSLGMLVSGATHLLMYLQSCNFPIWVDLLGGGFILSLVLSIVMYIEIRRDQENEV